VSAFEVLVWLLRLAFLGLLYLFLAVLARGLLRDLRGATSRGARAAGALVVMAAPPGSPTVGTTIVLETISTIGRDAGNVVVIDDPFASTRHARLTFRGRVWYLEDLASTNGTYVNGRPVEGAVPLGFGDEIAIGQTRFRLEPAPSA
jgi:pSer/pThr/pTyr-binding forkhead associated (FHA) protein